MAVIAGKYEVIEEIGSGSTGTVYLVRHVDLGVEYALKLLSHALSSEERFIERFKREASVLQTFSHPGSSRLRDFGKTEDGRYYMTTDFCPGKPLNEFLLQYGTFETAVALDVIIQVLDVLGAAHTSGVIHRDIKPENVMIEDCGDKRYMVRILDFGIAKLRERLELNQSVTMEGISVGTPQYMSPEQAAGDAVLDHRVDVYSVGVMMYELLTGEIPFVGESIIQTLLMHLTQPPPPFPETLEIPLMVEDLVMKALQKQPDRRYDDAYEFKSVCEAALQRIKEGGDLKNLRADDLGVSSVAADSEVFVADAAKERKPGAPTKVLCLDDNEMILDILSHILEREGYTVFTTTNSTTVHNYLFQERVDLLISDVMMPGLKGTQICRMLKQSMKSLKIVLFSNLPERELQQLSSESNADAWISKNAKPDSWLEIIKTVLAEHEEQQ